MANETFEHVVKQLKKNQTENSSGLEAVGKTVAALNDRINKFFEGLAQQRLDDLEARREQRKQSDKVAAATGGTTTKDAKGIGFLPLLFSKTGLVGSLLAVGGALAGLRGWEAGALKAIGKIKIGLTDNLTKNFRSLRASILTGLGLDATLKKFNSPESGLKTPITTQIIDKFKGLRTSVLKVFGLGADGKPIVVRGADGLFKTPVISKVTGFINKLLTPIRLIGDGIETFFKTSGKGLLSFLKFLGIGTAAAGIAGAGTGVIKTIAKVATKVLWPIGIVMSLFKGIEDYETKEGSKFEKIVAGVTGFVGDFLGAPLNLLKSLFTGALKKLGIGYDKDGNPTNFATKFLEKFDFVKAIKAIPDGIMAIINEVGKFLKDPIGVGSKVLKSITTSLRDFFINTLKSIIAYFGMESLAPSFLQTEGYKKLNAMKKEANELSEGAIDLGAERKKLAGGPNEKLRKAALERLAEFSKIEEMLRTGNFEKSIFGIGINSAEEARARLKELQEGRESDIQLIQKTSTLLTQMRESSTKAAALREEIAELTKALKENPNLVVDNKDLSSITNNNFNNAQSVIAADNLGFNTDNAEFRAVR